MAGTARLRRISQASDRLIGNPWSIELIFGNGGKMDASCITRVEFGQAGGKNF